MRILLTGATGFVGGRLLPRLLADGQEVRCLVRSQKSADKLASNQVETVIGDALQLSSLVAAMQDCDAAYYLIHSMGSGGDYEEQDRKCAQNFADAATQCNVDRVIYVSGLANEDDDDLSHHLASRLEVGKILRSGKTPCLELRAAMIIGAESISFQMVKHLCHRLPIMICPKWLSTQTQPLAISDLLDYLVKSLDIKTDESLVIEIGGGDQATYLDILKEYCQQKNLKRIMIPVPFLSTTLSSYWLALVTPETAAVGMQMIDGLRNPTIVRSPLANQLFDVAPLTIAQAIKVAIEDQTSAGFQQKKRGS